MYGDTVVEFEADAWTPASVMRYGWKAVMAAMDERTARFLDCESEVKKFESIHSALAQLSAPVLRGTLGSL